MKVCVIGCGNQGLGFAAQIITEKDVEFVLLLDYDMKAVSKGLELLSSLGGKTVQLDGGTVDASAKEDIVKWIQGCTVVLNATLPEFNIPVMEACLEAGAHYLDLYAHPDDAPYAEEGTTLAGQLALDERFAAAGLIAVPSVGVNPGWVLLAAQSEIKKMERVDTVKIREIEWIDSDELLCSGPPSILIEMFLGAPGPVRTIKGKAEAVDLVAGEEIYDFPAPIGKQGILPTSDNSASLRILADSPTPINCFEERFAVLSAGLTMKEILLTAVARQTIENETSENMMSLFGKSFKPTTAINFKEAHKNGEIRDAAWVSSVEISGIKDAKPIMRTTMLTATLEATLQRIPWATPGVLATTAMPIEIALMIGRGEINERGVCKLTCLKSADAVMKNVERRGVVVTSAAK